MTSAIVLSHRNVADELGHLEPWFERNGFTVRRIFREDRPELVDADLLVVLGSPSSVASGYCEQPGATEIALVEEWIRHDRPYLGICFGSQVLAQALGGSVRRMTKKYRSYTPMNLTSDPSSSLWEPMHQAMKDDELDLSRRAGLFPDTFWSHANSLVWGSSGTQS